MRKRKAVCVGVVLIGVLILEAGVWGLTGGILPNERRYLALREEGDHFLSLIRVLNQAAVERNLGADGAPQRFREAVSRLHDSVERMASVAGQEQDAPESEEAQQLDAALQETEGQPPVKSAVAGQSKGQPQP